MDLLDRMGCVLILFSGGKDSAFLLKVAKDALQDKMAALTFSGPTFKKKEFEAAFDFAVKLGVDLLVEEIDLLRLKAFVRNSSMRCYICRREMFAIANKKAGLFGFARIADGTTASDRLDSRPGYRAAMEASVASPLLKAGWLSNEIREASRFLGLATYGKASESCLATRISRGHKITIERLKTIEWLEEELKGMGVARVKHHGDLVRIVAYEGKAKELMEDSVKEYMMRICKKAGFKYCALDLQDRKL